MEGPAVCLEDFDVLQFVGIGGHSKVYLAQKKETQKFYALKMLEKRKVERCQEVTHTFNERNILSGYHHPFIVKLHYCFQSDENLYMVLDLVTGGDLAYNMKLQGTFSEERVKFYAAQLVLVLDFLHKHGIIYRDLKPENLLLNEKGYLLLCDFGISKVDMKDPDARTSSFCGTPAYFSPEMLNGLEYGTAVDWWQLGILLYQILCGKLPFYHPNSGIMWKNINSAPLVFPDHVLPDTQDIISKFLKREPSERLQDINVMQQHPYFTGLDWDKLSRKELPAPYIPESINPKDIHFVDTNEVFFSEDEDISDEETFFQPTGTTNWESFDYVSE